jgi:uncharacterized protein
VSVAEVVRINIAPVKALGLLHPEEVELTERGVEVNRRFYLISDEGRLVNGNDVGKLVRVRPTVEGGRLELRFPDGSLTAGEVELGDPVETNFWGRPVHGRLVEGPWSAALSAYAGKAVRLVRTETPGTGSDVRAGTIVSLASCARLGQELGADVDPRRFRMLLELDGLAEHEEDDWTDRPVRIGGAVVRVGGPVPRCAITTQDPDTGVPTLDTLRAIAGYRGLRNRKAIDFGVYFDVESPGRVRLGDSVEPL